jgi:hypothetical protein
MRPEKRKRSAEVRVNPPGTRRVRVQRRFWHLRTVIRTSARLVSRKDTTVPVGRRPRRVRSAPTLPPAEAAGNALRLSLSLLSVAAVPLPLTGPGRPAAPARPVVNVASAPRVVSAPFVAMRRTWYSVFARSPVSAWLTARGVTPASAPSDCVWLP